MRLFSCGIEVIRQNSVRCVTAVNVHRISLLHLGLEVSPTFYRMDFR